MSSAFKILVPTDFSEYSDKALDSAIELAKKLNGSIELLHCIDYSGYVLALDNTMLNTITLNEMYEELQKDAENKLKEKVDSLSEDIDIASTCVSGLPADEILEFSTGSKSSLIIMGTKGASNVADEILGTLTDKIVRKADCPVLAVHKNQGDLNLENVAIVSSFKEDLGENTELILQLLKACNAKVELVRINTVSDFENTRYTQSVMQSFAKKWNINNPTYTIYNHEHFESGLYYYSIESKMDLLVMGTHGRKGFNHFYHGGSKTEDVIKKLEAPVLSFRIK